MMPLQTQLAAIYLRARECGLKKWQLVENTGVDNQSISAIFSGKSRPRLDTFVNVAEALGYEVVLRPKSEKEKR